MTRTVDLSEAKTRLSQLIDDAAAGEEIIIAKAGKPKARLGPLPAANRKRKPGGWQGQVCFITGLHAGRGWKALNAI